MTRLLLTTLVALALASPASALTKSSGVTKVSTSDMNDTDDVWDPKPPKVGTADMNDTDD